MSSPISNRRFLIAAAIALAGVLATDHYLHAAGGFLRRFGPGTEEGQIQSKVGRAPRISEVADVIAFGSSYVRSGISGQPFLDANLIFWNFGISGAGPLTDYFALKRIEGVLAGRHQKPTLLVELNAFALTAQPNTLWAEYPQYLGIVRDRREMVRELVGVGRSFRGYGMTSQWISSLTLPSGLYRSHNVQLFTTPEALQTYFYGMEDVSGFAALYTVAAPSVFPAGAAPPPIRDDQWMPGKVAFLREFLRMSRAAGCPVVLFESPTLYLGKDAGRFQGLIASLEGEFGPLPLVRTSDMDLQAADFDISGHLNVRGSDRFARRLISRLGLAAQPGYQARIERAYETLALPPLSEWTVPGGRVAAQPGEAPAMIVDGGTLAAPLVARSAEIVVTPGQEYVFESVMQVSQGQLALRMVWTDSRGGQGHSDTLIPLEVMAMGETRAFLRGVPQSDRVRIEFTDWSAATGGQPSVAQLRPLRLWRNR